MKFLHTSDWHVGKTLKGRDRLDEQKAVLAEIVGHARAHDVDAVLIAGDIYDTAAPTAERSSSSSNTLLDAGPRRHRGRSRSPATTTTAPRSRPTGR